mmetsp:Transcript_30091/g.82664  ORF Transcript_30091/g.82664 Transcript_30091/m.82664 type:complete len:635 (-) Transcript_30091:121-2025(-)
MKRKPQAAVVGRSYDVFKDVELDADSNGQGADGTTENNRPVAADDVGEAGVETFNVEDIDEVATGGQLLLEFLRAVIPLTVFIVFYIGASLGAWILEPLMAISLLSVVLGLAVFKYGLLVGLMPFGKEIGSRLPVKVNPCVMALVIFSLGVLVTYSEPGINSLQIVGSIMHADGKMPEGAGPQLLLWMLSNERSFQLLSSVAIGVGLAAVAGVQRLRWRLGVRPVIFGSLVPTLALTAYCWLGPDQGALRSIVGLSWDCGAITTGPATVPIVLSIGMGVARSSGSAGELDGFGIVTLASLLPVSIVLAFGIVASSQVNGALLQVVDLGNQVVDLGNVTVEAESTLWEEFPLLQAWESVRAMGPLTSFLVSVQLLLIREIPGRRGKGRGPLDLARGILAAVLGLTFFNVGLHFGSMPLGEGAGAALSDSLTVYSPENGYPASLGIAVLMLFGFVAGFIATIIDLEPCGLGEAVERLSQGAFTKSDLFAAVASGVGVGIMLGFAKVIYDLDLFAVLVAGYSLALVLTLFADEGLCCVAWDSAGVTTGPVTVPLVLSMGLGLCGKLGRTDGFGILACASVCPIISVLAAAILRIRVCPRRLAEGVVEAADPGVNTSVPDCSFAENGGEADDGALDGK